MKNLVVTTEGRNRQVLLGLYNSQSKQFYHFTHLLATQISHTSNQLSFLVLLHNVVGPLHANR